MTTPVHGDVIAQLEVERRLRRRSAWARASGVVAGLTAGLFLRRLINHALVARMEPHFEAAIEIAAWLTAAVAGLLLAEAWRRGSSRRAEMSLIHAVARKHGVDPDALAALCGTAAGSDSAPGKGRFCQ